MNKLGKKVYLEDESIEVYMSICNCICKCSSEYGDRNSSDEGHNMGLDWK